MWHRLETLLYFWPGVSSTKLALFDLDGTLTVSPSGQKFGVDWILLPNVLHRLNQLQDQGFLSIIISNQKRFGPKTEQKIREVQNYLNLPIFVATGDDQYRKPNPGIINLIRQLNNVEVSEVFYSGDAIGSADPYPPYQWSDSDYQFALNSGMTFIRPLDVFPAEIPDLPTQPTLVIMMGNQGSGKSTSASRFPIHCEKDKLGKKLATCVETAVKNREIVAIDATNPSNESKRPWLELAEKYQSPVEIWWHVQDGRKFNSLRENPVSEIAYRIYTKNFEDPRNLGVPVRIVYF